MSAAQQRLNEITEQEKALTDEKYKLMADMCIYGKIK